MAASEGKTGPTVISAPRVGDVVEGAAPLAGGDVVGSFDDGGAAGAVGGPTWDGDDTGSEATFSQYGGQSEESKVYCSNPHPITLLYGRQFCFGFPFAGSAPLCVALTQAHMQPPTSTGSSEESRSLKI